MIVIGVDVQKYSLTAVAVDEVGRVLAERSGPGDDAAGPLDLRQDRADRSAGCDRGDATDGLDHAADGRLSAVARVDAAGSDREEPELGEDAGGASHAAPRPGDGRTPLEHADARRVQTMLHREESEAPDVRHRRRHEYRIRRRARCSRREAPERRGRLQTHST